MKQIFTLLFVLLVSCGGYAQAPGNALHFDGTDDHVLCAVPPVFTNIAANDFTVEAWVKPEGTGNARLFFVQLSNMEYATVFLSGGNSPLVYVGNGTLLQGRIAPTLLSIGQWSHIAITWDASATQINMYINGVQQTLSPGGSTSFGTGGLMAIGGKTNGTQILNGDLDEFRIWSEARTVCQINTNMHRMLLGNEPNLIHYYDFNQGFAGGLNTGVTTLPDMAGTVDGTLNGFALTGTTSNWIASDLSLTGTGEGETLVTDTTDVSICAGDTVVFGGHSLFAGGSYSDTLSSVWGCDSIHVLNLTVNSPVTHITTASACGMYDFNGDVLTASGIYYDTLVASNGCDSISQLNLTIKNSVTHVITLSACGIYDFSGDLLTASGVYHDTLVSAIGCDSIVQLNLTINTVDVGVTQSGVELTADATGASYQWVDCGQNQAPVTGATQATYIAEANGSYAVAVTQHGCIDTSACFGIGTVDVGEYLLSHIRIYPNPAQEFVTLSGVAGSVVETVSVTDVQGRVLLHFGQVALPTQVDVRSLPSGLYLVHLYGTGRKSTLRLVKN